MKGIWFLEWSNSQKCFHIGERDELLYKNLHSFINHRQTGDYVPIMMGTYQQCSDFAAKLEPVRQSIKCGGELKRARVH